MKQQCTEPQGYTKKETIYKGEMIMKVLVVIDMQKDFVTGVLGNVETSAVVKNVCATIDSFKKQKSDDLILYTLDTHGDNYLSTQEGSRLPVPHCIKGTDGWKLVPEVEATIGEKAIKVEKITFGSTELSNEIRHAADGKNIDEILLIGVCTDICVISNAMILKAEFPDVTIKVIAESCAGVTPDSHITALNAMKACQIDVI